ncbi:hypothetical protein Vretimale_14574, partial [Volvox reticuliferus]
KATAESGATAPGGSGGSGGDAAAATAAAAPVSATLTPEEWDRLQQLLHQEDVEDVDVPGGDDGTEGDGPYCLTALLEVAVERCSLELAGVRAEVAQPLISASMQAVGIRILRYPTTLGVSLRVGWTGLEAPQGMLLCTGQLSSNSNGLNKQPPVASLSDKGNSYRAAAAAGKVAMRGRKGQKRKAKESRSPARPQDRPMGRLAHLLYRPVGRLARPQHRPVAGAARTTEMAAAATAATSSLHVLSCWTLYGARRTVPPTPRCLYDWRPVT